MREGEVRLVSEPRPRGGKFSDMQQAAKPNVTNVDRLGMLTNADPVSDSRLVKNGDRDALCRSCFIQGKTIVEFCYERFEQY